MFSKLTLFFPLFIFCSCNSVNTQTKIQTIQNNNVNKNAAQIDAKVITEPLDDLNKLPENIRSVWRNFTADGKYRLAQPSEMTVSKITQSYVYIWGDLNYNKRIEDEHLAAIIVDTTKTDADKFSLVIFSPIRKTKDKYDINWLYRDKNLSKTIVSRASGDFYVAEYADDGSRKSCSVKWNVKLKTFECL